ncbi:MAG: hypothetical protein JXA93_01380, partial [Anaerolineae bacterium]|nr:hypothetical protein [Anaerolineae bacterium]
MEEHALEPGLLNTFRQYIAIRLGIMLLGSARYAFPIRAVPLPDLDPLFALPILLDGLFLTLLLLRSPRRLLGRYFLPAALLGTAVVQMLYLRLYSGHLGLREVGIGFVGQ